MTLKKAVPIALTVLWCIIIFVFSSRPAELSTEDSYTVARFIGKVFVRSFSEFSEEQQLAYAESIDHVVRKTAHAVEYMILAMFSFFAAGSLGVSKKIPAAAAAWAFTTVYAATDELHQTFVEGRSGQFTDVCIDSAGALAGVLLCCLVVLLLGKIKKKSNKP